MVFRTEVAVPVSISLPDYVPSHQSMLQSVLVSFKFREHSTEV